MDAQWQRLQRSSPPEVRFYAAGPSALTWRRKLVHRKIVSALPSDKQNVRFPVRRSGLTDTLGVLS